MPILAKVRYAVFGDYDGNAPDTCDLAAYDTEEEAKRVAKKLQETKDNDYKGFDEEDVITPYVGGWQSSLTFCVREILVRA